MRNLRGYIWRDIMAFDIAIDFGETTVTIAARGWKDSVITPCAVACKNGKVLAMGEDAQTLLGRTPRDIAVEYPLQGGRLRHENWLKEWVRHLISQCAPNARVKKASLLFTMSPAGDEGLARALKDAAMACDIQDVWQVDRTVAACAAQNMDMNDTTASLCAVLEEGYIDTATLCMGRVLRRFCISGGLREVDAAISERIRRQYSMAVGPVTAAEIRNQLGAARAIDGVKAPALGLDLRSGFPVMKEIESSLGEEASRKICDTLCECVQRMAAQASEEEAADLNRHPVLLLGPGASFTGLESYLTEKTGLSCRLASNQAENGLKRFLAEDELKKICRKM